MFKNRFILERTYCYTHKDYYAGSDEWDIIDNAMLLTHEQAWDLLDFYEFDSRDDQFLVIECDISVNIPLS